MNGTLASRFWKKVRFQNGCWLWTGAVAKDGYGRLRVGKRMVPAHRVALAIVDGPIPAGLQALHTCDVRDCVRVDHLYVGTPLDNVRDMIARGRASWQKKAVAA